MRILRRVEHSVLWLLGESDTAMANLRREAQSRGVEPGRLVFAKRVKTDDYLARYRLADLFLDTLPFNAGTTASDALWAGLPLVTCTGAAFAARMAGSVSGKIAKQLSASNLSALPSYASMMGSTVNCMRRTIER
jgi:predicted O-linked N-acetylglucosamine transferase (SPINDLY family)